MSVFSLAIGMVFRMLPVESAGAQVVPSPPNALCQGLVGCGSAAANVVALNAHVVLIWMLNIAAAICLVMIIWSGFNMVIALGDEGKVDKNRMNVLYALLGLVVVISSQVIVSVVGTTNFGQGGTPIAIVGNIFAAVVTSLRVILNITFALMVVIAGIRMVIARGKTEEYEKGKNMIIGAIMGAIIINLATALIRALVDIFVT